MHGKYHEHAFGGNKIQRFKDSRMKDKKKHITIHTESERNVNECECAWHLPNMVQLN